jgi:Tol biopolymer transport system component
VEAIPAVAVQNNTSPQPVTSPVGSRSVSRAAVIVGTLITGIMCGWLVLPVPDVPPARLIQFTIPLPDGSWTELAGTRQDFAISPDGSRLAFVASDESRSQLWLRELSALATRPIAPDRNVRGLVWATDSRSLYFDERNTVRQIAIDGEAARTIGQLPLRSPWMGLLKSGDDLTLYTRAGTFVLPASGGTPKRIDEAAYHRTQPLPSGFLLNVRYEGGIGRYRAWASNLKNPGDERPLVEADSRVAFVPVAPGDTNGHLLYLLAGTLVAQPFKARTLQLAGDPQAVAEKVFSFHPTGAAAFSASENGILVYRTVQQPSRLRWLDRNGRELATIGHPATFMTPFRLSPDGRRLAATVYEVEKGGMSVWVYDSQEGTARRLTTGRETEAMAVWSPDGARLAFGRAAGSTPKLYSRAADSEGPSVALPRAPFQLPTDWSRDGRFLLYQTTGGAGEPGADVVAVDLRGSGKVVPILHSEAQEFEAVFSPDGSSIAFISDETGRPELYVQPFAADPQPHVTGHKRQVSRGGSSVIRWRADGKELYYIGSDNWITATALDRSGQLGEIAR